MKSLLVPVRLGACLGACALSVGLLAGCGSDSNQGTTPGDGGSAGSVGEGGGGTAGAAGAGGSGGGSATCTPSVEIASDSRAFIITDPEVLAKFSLERVLQQMIDLTGDP